jgi:hypothetical protein
MVARHVPRSLLPLVGIWLIILILLYVCMSAYIVWSDCHLGVDGGWRAVTSYPLPIVSDEEAPVS